MPKKILAIITLLTLWSPALTHAVGLAFDPQFIISDQEMQSYTNWTRNDVQAFLDNKGSYLKNYQASDVSGTPKFAADIIYDAAARYQINPKFLLVTLQKEQSLITDDSPTDKQLNWATGYAVCDSCSMDDPRIQKYKGFGAQVDSAAGVMRWYYQNSNRDYIKKKDVPISIDNQNITPQSWATAFLYTYTPHIHGNQNFWRIWNTWFAQVYPDGTLLQGTSSTETWLIQDGKKRKFTNKTALITRADPKMIVPISDIELGNYPEGTPISFANYSVLRTPDQKIYLVDYDTIRPFDSAQTVGKLGFNPQEIIDVTLDDIAGYSIGNVISSSSTPPQGIIYQITDLNNAYFILKDTTLKPILDKRIVEINFKNISIEKKKRKDIAQYSIDADPVKFKDGTLLGAKDSTLIFVIEKGMRRRISDKDTFFALGYKPENIVITDERTILSLPEGDPLFVNTALSSSQTKYLGDSEAEVDDIFQSKLPAYLVAEFPSGRILAGKNIDTKRPIASLTKLVTAYEAIHQNFKPSQFTIFNSKKHDVYKNVLNFKNGEKIKNNDLLNTLLVASVNNTARMVAQSTGLTETAFIKNMNNRLSEWGADNTHLSDVTGLDEKNVSSPRDLLKIFTKVASDSSLKTILGKSSFELKSTLNKKTISRTIQNTNQLISNPSDDYRIIASKTGYTDEAGATLIMLIESKKDKKEYVIITMGGTDYAHRFNEPNRISSLAVKNSTTTQVAKQN
jgi:D-alanyl-D-alanine endopeptidase (penicillin-binding protein 7)